MRRQIKALARDLLIERGYRGVSFGDIATALDTTRANIHYHFGNKHKLVEEVLEDYVEETLDGLKTAFGRDDLPLTGKIAGVVEISRRRHRKYNPTGKGTAPWSLIARMRQDSAALTPKGRAALERFAQELDASVTAAVRAARDQGEFIESMPVEDVALQLVCDRQQRRPDHPGRRGLRPAGAALPRLRPHRAARLRQAARHVATCAPTTTARGSAGRG